LWRIQSRLGEVTSSNGLESVYRSITKCIRRRRVSTDDALGSATVNQTDVIRGVAETLVIWVNACLGYCGPAPGEAPPSPRSSRLLPCYGDRQSAGWPSRAIARWGCTAGLDEPLSPVAGFHSTGRRAVGARTAIAAANGRRLERSGGPSTPAERELAVDTPTVIAARRLFGYSSYGALVVQIRVE